MIEGLGKISYNGAGAAASHVERVPWNSYSGGWGIWLQYITHFVPKERGIQGHI